MNLSVCLDAVYRNRSLAESIEVTAICTHFISLAEPPARSSYLEGLRSSIEAAKRLKCRQLITQVGNELPHISREVQRESIIVGL